MEQPSEGGTDSEDRVVSRRVDHPTEAGPHDEATYDAADPAPDGDTPEQGSSSGSAPADAGGATEAAASEVAGTDESEPTRSE